MTSPLVGSIATAAARWPRNASSAACCTRTSIVRNRSLPAIGSCRSSVTASWPMRSTERPCAFTSNCWTPARPCSSRSYARSTPLLPVSVVPAYSLRSSDLLVFFADGADVADRVHAAGAERVVARQARPDLHAGELVAAGGEARQFLVGELQLDRHGLEDAPAANVFLQAREVGVVEQPELRQADQRRVDVGDLLARQLQLIRGRVGRERQAVAVEDQPAVRRNRLDLDAVALREIREVVVLNDLQPHQSRDHRAEREQHDDCGRDRASLEQPLLGVMILDADGAAHRFRRFQVSRMATSTGHSSALVNTGIQRIQVVTG